jgi:5-methylcytosine-specific restriction enzyme A
MYGRARWKREKSVHLDENPLCVDCLKDGVYSGGSTRRPNHVDHIVPHRGDDTLFWDRTNWQTLCQRHHAIKSAREKRRS